MIRKTINVSISGPEADIIFELLYAKKVRNLNPTFRTSRFEYLVNFLSAIMRIGVSPRHRCRRERYKPDAMIVAIARDTTRVSDVPIVLQKKVTSIPMSVSRGPLNLRQ